MSALNELNIPYALDQSAIDFYQKNCYIKLKQVFSKEVLDHYGRSIDRAVDRLNKHAKPIAQRDTYDKVFLQLSNLWREDEQVKEFVGTKDNIHYFQGRFPETAQRMDPATRFALVHLDADLYEPTKAGLEYFYDKLEPGGFLILHDYGSPHWPGVLRAAQEFFANKPEKLIRIPDRSGSSLIRKI